MKIKLAGLMLLGMGAVGAARGQSIPTATQALELSVFGTGTETFTGLENGRNLAITAGVDLSFRTFFGVRPALEVRGTYPGDHGDVVGEKSALAGPRFMKTYGRFHPYADGLFGRGALEYVGGFVVGTFRYDRTTTNVFGAGGGVDIAVTEHFDVKADAQIEHWATPVTASGSLYSTPVSVGIVYHLDFNRFGHHTKMPKDRPGVTGPASTPAAPAEAAPVAPETMPAAAAPSAPPASDAVPAAPSAAAPAATDAAPAPPPSSASDRTGTSTPPADPKF